jgi:hypothetical protein
VSELAFGTPDNHQIGSCKSVDGVNRLVPNGVALGCFLVGLKPDDGGMLAKATAALQATLPPAVTPEIRADILRLVRRFP